MAGKMSPVGIFTYTRLTKLKKAINALKNNTLANKTELYIFSDAAKLGDENKVAELREYIYTVKGFKKINIVIRESNSRLFNVDNGVEALLEKYEKCIIMEDDVITAPGFLQFMNDALDFYKDDTSIFSVGGYSPVDHSGVHDFYLSPRFQSWGCGFWKEKYYLVKDIPPFEVIKKDTACMSLLIEMGEDMLHNIKTESLGKIDGFDIRACYLCAKNNMFNILPSQTLVGNIGMDGSGIHSGIDKRYSKRVLSKNINFHFQSIQDIDWKWSRLCVSNNDVAYKKRPFLLRVANIPNWIRKKFRDS